MTILQPPHKHTIAEQEWNNAYYRRTIEPVNPGKRKKHLPTLHRSEFKAKGKRGKDPVIEELGERSIWLMCIWLVAVTADES